MALPTASPMRTRNSIMLGALGLLGACSTPAGNPPSLAPRAAEAIDPRVPIPNEVPVGPADASLSDHLAALIDQAQAGDSAFRAAAETAERLANAAGAPQSESWIAAQQALSVAQGARAPTTRALGDIDGLAATALKTKGGIPAGNLNAIQAAAAKVSEIDRRQAERIEAIENRLRA
ncbi:MAG: hypothetical protein HOP96_11590 [Sphingomonas sp.]|nr:hypothetical protein [Sphingomonas sp.]